MSDDVKPSQTVKTCHPKAVTTVIKPVKGTVTHFGKYGGLLLKVT